MDTRAELKARASEAETIIAKYCPKEEGYARTVIEAMNYSIHAGGKRLRPVLMLETYKLFGGTDMADIEPYAAAIEMIHTYSLVHDDLPAMDNDDYRRGRETTHKVYGEAMGILAGDGLLNLAYEVASDALLDSHNIERKARAYKVLARKPGYSGMLGGQVIDLEAEGQDSVSLNTVIKMYVWKTGALLECAMMIGAILAGAADDEVADIERIAGLVGLAFQIQDDILDITGDETKLGKPVHSDEKNDKSTYVSLVGLQAAQQKVIEYSEEAMAGIKVYEQRQEGYDGFLSRLFEYMIYREN